MYTSCTFDFVLPVKVTFQNLPQYKYFYIPLYLAISKTEFNNSFERGESSALRFVLCPLGQKLCRTTDGTRVPTHPKCPRASKCGMAVQTKELQAYGDMESVVDNYRGSSSSAKYKAVI